MFKKSYWVYILLCSNNTYYTGYTNDLGKRYAAHVAGTASKYTRSFKPIKIAQSWEIEGEKSSAMKIERYIKKLTRREKERIIKSPSSLYEGRLEGDTARILS
jgi:putative endonuclease